MVKRKEQVNEAVAQEEVPEVTEEEPTKKKGRGRPPGPDGPKVKPEKPKRGRGRPKKSDEMRGRHLRKTE